MKIWLSKRRGVPVVIAGIPVTVPGFIPGLCFVIPVVVAESGFPLGAFASAQDDMA
jgi:hypothetical protein